MWRNTSMLVLGSQFTKLLMSESPFLLSHPVITPYYMLLKRGVKSYWKWCSWMTQSHGTYSISHAYQVAWIWHSTIIITVYFPFHLTTIGYLAYAKTNSQAVSHCCSVACPNTTPKNKKSASVLQSTVSVLADYSMKIADNFPFVTIPINKRGITDMPG
jgi:hypothetical protein